ncbi:MAG: pantoate--beta-alanine ligase [Cyanobacteria bacterium]|nr:pantoate--beta-alanine ligase [Cyanobacteriota bacterium]
MKQLNTIQACREFRKEFFKETIGLVPTMGALHEGHLALIQMAKRVSSKVVVSIFVNPLQFRPSEDFTKYPRPVESDLLKCKELGVDAVFTPTVPEMYPEHESYSELLLTRVIPSTLLTETLCGVTRPGHFTGVATVVLKLLNSVQPDFAIFGEKDAQQLAVIRQMVKDLNVPVEILSHPTVRDKNGLALSSRNSYLKTPEQHQAALVLNKTLERMSQKLSASPHQELKNGDILQITLNEVMQGLGVLPEYFQLEYLECVDSESFQPVDTIRASTRIVMAAKIGDVRLIDNLELKNQENISTSFEEKQSIRTPLNI